LEVVERDATALWWYNRIRRRGVDLHSFGLPYLDDLVRHYRFIGRDLWALDITSDLGVPSFACLSRRTDHATEDVVLGLGSHLDPRVALLRAVTEANQFLPAVSLQDRSGSTRYLFGDGLAVDWWLRARVEDLAYLRPDPDLPLATSDDFEDLSRDDLKDDVLDLVERVSRSGLDVLLLDQTLPDVGLPVVRVIVPGLCHFWRRLGHTRLYSVPQEMGWLDRALDESELNPFTVFF
jgi:ribosomal protein S12 methylthiotransferase accessory factor